jgi:S1-C subfamily serine protease
VIEDLRLGKAVRTAFLGVVTQQVTPALATEMHLTTQTGAVVRQVSSGSPAAAAGIKKGDVVITFDHQQILTPDTLGGAVRKLNPGAKVDVLIEHHGTQKTVSVTLGTRPTSNG